jgi:HSP20 family protein
MPQDPFPFKSLPIRNLEQQIDQAFDELIHGKWGLTSRSIVWEPAIDVYETPQDYLVEADVPGVAPDDIQVRIEDQWLTISGERRSSQVEQSAHGVRIERRKGSFFRRFYLEHPVDPQCVERTDQEGTLLLRIPKQQRGVSHESSPE